MPRQRAGDDDDLKPMLGTLAGRLRESRRLRPGYVVFRTRDGRDVHLEASRDAVEVRDGVPTGASGPRAELIGDARRLRAILEGRKNARAQFLAGGFRVRGDLRYLSELAQELGLIDRPI